MDLELDADQIELRDHARAFLDGACPRSLVRGVYEGAADGPVDGLWKAMVDLGWPGLAAPEAVGGLGQGVVAEAVLVAELGRAVAPGPYLATVTQLAPLLAESGADDVLAEVAAGRCTGALALPDARRPGLDGAVVTARPVAGGWVLDGVAHHVLDGATADEVAVVARAADGEGLGAFLVDRARLTSRPVASIDPTMRLATVHLDGVEVPADRVLLDPGDPASADGIEATRLHATVAMALSCVATCRSIFETTVAYAKDRHQFGRPIGSFQAIKHRLADLYLAVERADALAWFAVATLAEGDPRLPLAASMAKAAAADCQRLATRDGLQLHGGIGFTWEHDLHFLLKRALVTSSLLGGGEHHRATLAHHLDAAPPSLELSVETRRTVEQPQEVRAAGAGGGMRLRFDDDVEAFRSELVRWLEANRPSAEEMAAEPSTSTGHAPAWARRWTRTMFDAGWLVPGWPPELGGRNATPVQTLVYLEELGRARVPRTTNVQGLGIVAPSIIDYGTPEQVAEYAMPILHGERTACLGMSEPDAGSDLAGLRTRAVPDGDHFVVDGQKVWTSGANHADFCLLFCRTDPDAPKHQGISILLVDMDTPGITVRPLAELVHPDHPDLNEVFFDGVRVPADHVVGELGDGWRMANGSLAHERGMVWVSAVQHIDEALGELLTQVPDLAARLDPTERALALDRVVKVAIDAAAARCLGYRSFAKLARGGSAPEQALMKLFASEVRQRLAEVAADLQGPDGLVVGTVSLDGHLAVDEPQGTWLEQYLQSFANTISAGTSEIQRNIIAERVLGLPREPKP